MITPERRTHLRNHLTTANSAHLTARQGLELLDTIDQLTEALAKTQPAAITALLQALTPTEGAAP